MTETADLTEPPPFKVPDRSAAQAQMLFRAALVLGPLAALLGAGASQLAAFRAPAALTTPPLQTFVVLVNLFFCLPYLAAYAFAFTARDPAVRAHRHAVMFALLVFGTMALAAMVALFAQR